MSTTLALILAGAALAQAPTDRPDPGEEKPFVFERKGRRDPFVDPRTPRVEPLPPPSPDHDTPQLADSTEKRLRRAHPPGMTDPVLLARALLTLAEEAFRDGDLRPSQRVAEIEVWMGKMRPLSGQSDRVRPLLASGEKLLSRARIHVEFEARKPAITGLLYSLEDVVTPHRLGVALFGRPVCVEAGLPVPNSRSTVVLRVQGSTTGDRSFSEGDPVDEGGDLRVGRIEKNQVAFVYREETILVPTPR